MTRPRLGSGAPRFDFDGLVYVLRDNVGRADAFLTAAEDLLERCWGDGDEEDDEDECRRRRNHVAHLVESAKLAVRAAEHAGEDLAKRGAAS